MEDRIYYVESPDGGVLGPLTMIQILEGIAAEVLLETARICEVGRSDWVELREVVETREDELESWDDPVANGAPAEPPPPARPEHTLVDADLSERDLHHIQTAALHEMDMKQELGLDGDHDFELESVSLEEHELDEPVVISPDAYFSPLSMPSLASETPAPSMSAAAPPTYESTIYSDGPLIPNQELLPLNASFEEEEVFEHDPEFGLQRNLDDPGDFASPAGDEDSEAFAQAPIAMEMYEGSAASRNPLEDTVKMGRPSPSGAFEEIIIGDEHEDFDFELPEPSSGPPPHVEPERPPRRRPNALVPVLAGVGAAAVLAIVFFVLHLSTRAKETPSGAGDASSTGAPATTPATESDRKKATAFLESGREKLQAKNPDAAIDAFTQALGLEPRLHEARAELARALAASGRKSPAIDEMTKYLEDVPDDYTAQRERLDWMIATGKNGDAGMIYGELAAKSPDVPELQLMAGLSTDEPDRAVELLRRATELDPQNEEAKAALAAALAKVPNAPEPDKETPVDPARSPEFNASIREIRAALELENYDDARKEIDAARKKLGKDPEIARNLALWRGITDFEEGRYERALSQFESLDEKASYDASGWGRGAVSNWIARSYLAQGDYRSAVLAFGLVEGADPDEIAMAKLWEGVALQSLGMEELARRMWKQMPGEVGTLVQGPGKGAVKTAQFLTGILSEKEYLSSVTSIGDFKNDMHYFMGRVAKSKEDPSTALGHFQRAMEASRGREFPYGLALRETNPAAAASGGDSDGEESAGE